MDFSDLIINQHRNIDITTKTSMETVSRRRKQQRVGDGASPVQVTTAQDHSGVSVPKGRFEKTGKDQVRTDGNLR